MFHVVVLVAALAGEGAVSDAVVRYVGEPADWTAGQDGLAAGPWYATPQEALAAAADGDTLVLVGGESNERLNVTRSVRILGRGSEMPVLRGPVRVVANDVQLERLHLVGVETAGVLFQGVQGGRVAHCRFSECQQGVNVRSSTGVTVEDNEFLFVRGAVNLNGGGDHLVRGNTIDAPSWRVLNVEASPRTRILDNRILRSGWVGILLVGGADEVLVAGNHIEGGQVGINLHTDGNTVERNVIRGAHHGIYLGRSPFGREASHGPFLDAEPGTVDQVVAAGNTLRGNHLLDCRREGLLLKDARDNVVEGNEFLRCRGHGIVLMGASLDNHLVDNRFAGTGDARGPRADVLDRTDPTTRPDRWRLTPAPDGSRWSIAFGDFHAHSLLSDGGNRADEVLTYARDVATLDFCALSDHAEDLVQRAGHWERLQEAVAAAAVPGEFVTFAGYETTYLAEWWGHYNVYFPGAAGRVYPAPHAGEFGIPRFDALTPFELLDHLRADGTEALVLRHHYYRSPSYWAETPEDAFLMPMTEVCSVHAIWCGDGSVDRNYTLRTQEAEGMFSTMQGALEAGRVLGIGAGSDSHYGFPSDFGLVAVLTQELTPAAITQAVRDRRTYATTGARIELAFSIDGQPMGSNLTEPPRAFRIVVHGTHDLEEVTLFGPRGFAVNGFLQGARCSVSRKFPVAQEGDGFQPGDVFRVRVRQSDGELAWSSPIWYRATPAAGPAPDVVTDKSAMSLMLYAASLRTWPDQLLDELERRSPRAAMQEEPWRARVVERWPAVERCVAEIRRRGEALGLDQPGALDRVRARYLARLDEVLPGSIRYELATMAWPLVDLGALREALGLRDE